MKYNFICTDIDGTLLNKDRELSPCTIQELKRIKDTAPIILISSRMPKAMRHLQKELGIEHLPLIAYNGGLILDGNNVLESTDISVNIISEVVSNCKNTSIHLSLYHNDEWFVPEMDYWANREANNTKVTPTVRALQETLIDWKNSNKGAHKIMCMGEESEISALYSALETKFPNDLSLYRSKPTYIEIANKKISKETAIYKLLQECYPNQKIEHVIAFGDNYNDIEMLKAVGMGVAVKNAKNEVLAIANDITESNIDDGVALSIQKYFE
ncbi:Cof-type HAD-IIB family hydrolase [Cochleicola gelatinilyticus]|uniref:Haloacid dehalogenase n=1 Tax=Cochleicola gelatinilyticus TaxID=1763537 RepID=A0A167HVA3_9FLAO|nr:Cof-type HAD-IIB family hydrolase [Cochleicola gelatinilyticus]OAB78997.1 haloacid dehalogenase [Cochleicola gelatinilyticus]